jgi:hypothetical protein
MTTSNEPARTDTDIRQPMQQRDRKHRLAPALTDAQLDELMARFRERFRLGN